MRGDDDLETCIGRADADLYRRYAFRYLGDRDGEGERWFNDEVADAYESNGMGADNSIVDLRTPR